jgi:mono/diheme cytochrome c family protein
MEVMMRSIALVVCVFLMVLALNMPGRAAQGGNAAKGKAVYTSKCATCHGAAGEGKEAIAKMFKVELKHLGAKEVQSKSDADIKKVITDGSGKMKPVKLTDQEMADVIAYFRTLKK